jgi:choline dehydrogenase-like flavoprotein
MLYDGEHRKEYAACLMESGNHPFFRIEKGKWRNIAKLRLIFEDLPDDNNHVTTTANRMKPQVTHHGHSEYVSKAIHSMDKRLTQMLSMMPVEKIDIDTKLIPTEAHVLGTTRMSHSAAEGVVDKHLLHHSYRNLFVLGGSTFCTYSPANPTLTISALSLHAADKSF